MVDEGHRSWDDDSTGPKDENTEEAEAGSLNFIENYNNCFIFRHLSTCGDQT